MLDMYAIQHEFTLEEIYMSHKESVGLRSYNINPYPNVWENLWCSICKKKLIDLPEAHRNIYKG